MPPQPDGQSGYCGNFNGDAQDDFKYISPSFHMPIGSDLGPVNSEHELFNTSKWEAWDPKHNDNATWLDPASVLSNCDPSLKDLAINRCKTITDARINSDCIIDVCATGLEAAA